MIRQRTNGLSLGEFASGVMLGETDFFFKFLHLPSIFDGMVQKMVEKTQAMDVYNY